MQYWIEHVAAIAAQSYAVDISQYLAVAGGASLALWCFARVVMGRRVQPSLPTVSARWMEVTRGLRTIAVFSGVTLLIVLLSEQGILTLPSSYPAWPAAILEIAALVIAHDTYFYWSHRCMHSRAMFLRAHATHHRSRTPSPWTAYSFAPLEAVNEAAFLPFALIIWPFPMVVIGAFMLHQLIRNVIGHMGHELAPVGFTRSPWTGWLTTTTHHDLHHTEGRYNFGLYFTWWDRWMGTEHPRYHQIFEAIAAGSAERPARSTPLVAHAEYVGRPDRASRAAGEQRLDG